MGRKNIDSGVKGTTDVATQQLSTSKTQTDNAAADKARMDKLIQPAIDFNTALASGDREKSLAVAAPAIRTITDGYRAAKDNIINTVPAGPARDFALASLERDRTTSTTDAITQPFLSSFDKLANIGSGVGSFSLQELGAGIRSGEGAGLSFGDIAKTGAAQKQSTMGFFGSLAQAAGGVAGKLVK